MAGKGKPLSEQTTEQLNSMQNALVGVLAVMLVLLGCYVGYYAYLIATDRFDTDRHLIGIIPGLMLIPVSTPMLIVIGKIRAELAKRR
ncbi:MAG: hypothetical protein AAGE01_11830 [Pseudomonadota bacterium]